MKRYNVSANRYNDGYAGTGTGTMGFFQKKLTGPSQARTRVPVYPPIPGHGYKYRGYRARIHGYGLYPAVFSKPLLLSNRLSDLVFFSIFVE
jgi:hypothetical protein